MKKIIVTFLSVMMLILAAGCSTQNAEETKAPEKETEQVTAQDETEAKTPRETAEALDVSEDAFAFDALVSQTGKTAEEFAAFLGEKEASDTYEKILFGEKAAVTVKCDEKTVQSITLKFEKTNMDSLYIAISEQLGQDGEDSGDVTVWAYEGSKVQLSQDGDFSVIEITK